MNIPSYWVKLIQDEAFAAGLQRAKELADAREELRKAEFHSVPKNIFVTTPHTDGTGIVLNRTIVAETLRYMLCSSGDRDKIISGLWEALGHTDPPPC